MDEFLGYFKGNANQQKKYNELLSLKKDASAAACQRHRDLRRVAVVLTTKCNLKCVWCHRNDERFKDYLNKDMSINRLRLILPQLKGFLWLHFGGLGEPLLHPHIFDAIKEAKGYIPNVRITTNGILLNKENCRRLIKAGLSLLEVSIDGFDSIVNKKVRGVHEDELINNLKYLSDNSDIPIQINSVISDINYDSLFGAVDRLKDIKNIILLHTIPLFMTNHMKKLGIKDITTEQHRELILHWKRRCDRLNLKCNIWPDPDKAESDPVIIMKRRHNLCFTVYHDPFINVFGCLSPCGRLQEISLGSIEDIDFGDTWNGSRMMDWRRRQLRGDYHKVCQLECHMKNA